jgi:hypothetical protein
VQTGDSGQGITHGVVGSLLNSADGTALNAHCGTPRPRWKIGAFPSRRELRTGTGAIPAGSSEFQCNVVAGRSIDRVAKGELEAANRARIITVKNGSRFARRKSRKEETNIFSLHSPYRQLSSSIRPLN